MILAISDSDKHFVTACDEYVKRLGNEVTVKSLKPIKGDTQHHTIHKETASMMRLLEKEYHWRYKVLLSIGGKQMHTLAFQQFCSQHEKIVFIIGGPYGLDEVTMTPVVDAKISLSSFTLPHWLAKLVLLEQLYRIQTIQMGKKYHY